MSPNSSGRVPKLRLHKPSRRAVVRFDGTDYYLGKYGSPESQNEYDRMVGEWMLRGRQAPPKANGRSSEMSVGELIVAYVTFADGYYRKNGQPTGEYDAIRYSLRHIRRLYGTTSVNRFGPLALKNVREAMLNDTLCRPEINKRIGRIVRMFKWGVSNEFVPPMIHHALSQVTGLRRGRTTAREPLPIKPVKISDVEAVKSYVSRQVWTMIELQRLTGMRPGEACQMRWCDIDRSQQPWMYRPMSHKTEHHGHVRQVFIGPKAQKILSAWLNRSPSDFLFSPKDELAERNVARRKSRKTRVQPSQQKRTKKIHPKRSPRERYSTASYGRAIARGCERAGIDGWQPNQLRHTAATRIRKEFGLDAASVILGHRGVAITQVYAERDEARAANVISQIG
ncbi:MAG: tyrosine-type recombinase/integrase [Pirellulaceae bacterium]